MPIPNLSDFTDMLVETTDAYLEDTIQYAADGASYAGVQAWVEYGEALRDAATGLIVEQDIVVKISKLQVENKPAPSARLILPRLATTAFKPVNVINIGTDWQMGVARV